jgi:hypothetical protein
MYRHNAIHDFRAFLENLFSRDIARGRSAAKDGAANEALRCPRHHTHNRSGIRANQPWRLEITDQTERRQNNGYSHTRGRSSRLKRGNRTVDCRIGTLDRGKEKSDPDAQDGQNNENCQFPSNSGQDHRSVTGRL